MTKISFNEYDQLEYEDIADIFDVEHTRLNVPSPIKRAELYMEHTRILLDYISALKKSAEYYYKKSNHISDLDYEKILIHCKNIQNSVNELKECIGEHNNNVPTG